MKLSKAQRDELQLLDREKQRTYGKHRALVQNNLVRRGLARIVTDLEDNTEFCFITGAGRAALTAPDVTELELEVLKLAAAGTPWEGSPTGVGSRRRSQALGRLLRKGLLQGALELTESGRAVLKEAGVL